MRRVLELACSNLRPQIISLDKQIGELIVKRDELAKELMSYEDELGNTKVFLPKTQDTPPEQFTEDSNPPKSNKKKRGVNSETRLKMSKAQKLRWAKNKSQQDSDTASAEKPAKKKRRRLSAAGRKNIIEASKKRWAEFRAAKKTHEDS